jgi:hypothetical protein
MIALVADARAQWAGLDRRIAASDAEFVRWTKGPARRDAVTARAAFVRTLTVGPSFKPLDRVTAAAHAQKRVERGHVVLYRVFRER